MTPRCASCDFAPDIDALHLLSLPHSNRRRYVRLDFCPMPLTNERLCGEMFVFDGTLSCVSAGVYAMWNLYVIALLSLYAPSHKRKPLHDAGTFTLRST